MDERQRQKFKTRLARALEKAEDDSVEEDILACMGWLESENWHLWEWQEKAEVILSAMDRRMTHLEDTMPKDYAPRFERLETHMGDLLSGLKILTVAFVGAFATLILGRIGGLF